MEKFDEIRKDLWNSFEVMKPTDGGDLSDIGNEIGIVIAKHFDKDNTLIDFINGVRHGVSLTDGTHDKEYPSI